VIDRARALAEAGLLRERVTGFVPAHAEDYPAGRVALRSASFDNFALIDSSLGRDPRHDRGHARLLDGARGAIYLHLGRSYNVLELDFAARRAILEPFHGNYFTQAKSESMTYIERMLETRETHGVRLSYGEVVYSETVLGYQRKGLQDHVVIDFQSLDMPTTEFATRALWYELDAVVGGPLAPNPAEAFPPDLLLGSLHALEHAQIAVLPLIAMCDRWTSRALDQRTPADGGPTIFIYDGHPGGIGITRRGYDPLTGWCSDAQRLIGECPCKDGCPSCVQSPKCGNLNDPLSKRGSLELLARMQA